MATRCHVGYIDNGEMIAVYSHWDGYPSGLLLLGILYIFDRQSGGLVETYQYGEKVPVKTILAQANERLRELLE